MLHKYLNKAGSTLYQTTNFVNSTPLNAFADGDVNKGIFLSYNKTEKKKYSWQPVVSPFLIPAVFKRLPLRPS